MLEVRVDPHLSTAPSRQLIDAVLDAIASADLKPGDRLPSVRALAASALVNPNTVSKAYRELELLDIVIGRNGSGVFVTDAGPARARELRHDATLATLRQAVEEALRAGHAPEQLHRLVDRAAIPNPARNP